MQKYLKQITYLNKHRLVMDRPLFFQYVETHTAASM